MLGGDSHTKIKGGNKVVFSSGSMSVAKLEKQEKKEIDDLDAWSKERAETVAKANSKMRRRDINSMVLAMRDPFFPRRSGFWVFNRAFGCYTFVPLFLGWGSPYGSSYSRTFYGNPWWGNGYGGLYGGGVAGGGSGGSGGGGSTPNPTYNPPPRISPGVAPALERKVERLNDRMPNQP
jgi:hypothetical protein